MSITVVSGMHPAGYEQYGKAFLDTFDQFWPQNIKLCVYLEEPIRLNKYQRISQRSLWDIPGQQEFIERHKDNLVAHGRAPHPFWTKKSHRDYQGGGYAFRFDAVRFSRQLFIPDHAVALMPDDDIFVWLDADVVSYATVPDDLVERLLDGHDLVFLGRETTSTDLGFWAMRVNERTRAFARSMADRCRSDKIFELPQWHSGFVFDHLKTGLKRKSLTQGDGHVWFQCEIGRYTDHLKGEKRKAMGRSMERI